MKKFIGVLLSMVVLLSGVSTYSYSVPVYAEQLERGLAAVCSDEGVFISWRLLPDEVGCTDFILKRNARQIAYITESTNYFDANGTIDSDYTVTPVKNGVNGTSSAPISAFSSGLNYFDIPLDVPDDAVLADGTTVAYTPGDASCADLDGDGEYELVLKWDAAPRDNSHDGYTGNVLLDAYKYDGTKLWRIDLGPNIRAGAHYTQFIARDFDGDGNAELATKTAPGSVDGNGNFVSCASYDEEILDCDNSAVYVNSAGKVLDGPEFYTVFDGKTGAAIDTVSYPFPRGNLYDWGDSSGNRVDRFLACAASLDGKTVSVVTLRGYYGKTTACAYNLIDSRLTEVARFDTSDDSMGIYAGQGNHNIAAADIDGDGCDEILTGSLCLDNDLTPLWCSYRGHGDALHLGDYDPTNEGLEYFTVHESNGIAADGRINDYGMTVHSASSGEILFHTAGSSDTGRGIMANVGTGGFYQIISSATGYYLSNGRDEFQATSIPRASMNFRIFWDGDLYDELLDGVSVTSWNGYSMAEIFSADGCTSINGTKATPSLCADLFGDWREELVFPTTDGSALRVFMSDIVTGIKLPTLMSDPTYRNAVTAQNVGYNQPAHIGYLPVESISVTTPDKTVYSPGESFDTTGLTVTARYIGGLEQEVSYYDISGFDSSYTGDQLVKIIYCGAIAELPVTVESSEVGNDYIVKTDFSEYPSDFVNLQTNSTYSVTEGSITYTIAGRRNGSGDGFTGFSISSENENAYLQLREGRFSNNNRQPKITFDTRPSLTDDTVLSFKLRFHDDILGSDEKPCMLYLSVHDGAEEITALSPDSLNIEADAWYEYRLMQHAGIIYETLLASDGSPLFLREINSAADAIAGIEILRYTGDDYSDSYGDGVGAICDIDDLAIYRTGRAINTATVTAVNEYRQILNADIICGEISSVNEISLPVGEYIAKISADGYEEKQITLPLESGDCNVDVTLEKKPIEITGITLNRNTLSLPVDGFFRLNASAVPENADYEIVWSTSDKNIAAVSDGLVIGTSEGEAIITARTYDGKFASECKVNVISAISSAPAAIEITGPEELLCSNIMNTTAQFTVQTFNSDGVPINDKTRYLLRPTVTGAAISSSTGLLTITPECAAESITVRARSATDTSVYTDITVPVRYVISSIAGVSADYSSEEFSNFVLYQNSSGDAAEIGGITFGVGARADGGDGTTGFTVDGGRLLMRAGQYSGSNRNAYILLPDNGAMTDGAVHTLSFNFELADNGYIPVMTISDSTTADTTVGNYVDSVAYARYDGNVKAGIKYNYTMTFTGNTICSTITDTNGIVWTKTYTTAADRISKIALNAYELPSGKEYAGIYISNLSLTSSQSPTALTVLLTEDGVPLEGEKVTITCGEYAYEGVTDKYGRAVFALSPGIARISVRGYDEYVEICADSVNYMADFFSPCKSVVTLPELGVTYIAVTSQESISAASVICAGYDADGRLLKMQSKNSAIAKGDNVFRFDTADIVKAFVWDNISTMKPLC